MVSSEHIFHRPHVAFTPDDKTGSDASGQTGTELPQQQNLFSEDPHSENVDQSVSGSAPYNAERLARKTKNDEWYDQLLASKGLMRGDPVDLSNQPESVGCFSRFLDTKGIDLEKDLSPGAKWLFDELLLGGKKGRGRKTIARYAEWDGIDLATVIQELDQYGLIDLSNADNYDLAWEKLTPRW